MINLRSLIAYRLLGPPNCDEVIVKDVINPDKPKYAKPMKTAPELAYPILQYKFSKLEKDPMATKMECFVDFIKSDPEEPPYDEPQDHDPMPTLVAPCIYFPDKNPEPTDIFAHDASMKKVPTELNIAVSRNIYSEINSTGSKSTSRNIQQTLNVALDATSEVRSQYTDNVQLEITK